MNAAEQCVRASDVAEGQILRQYALVELSLHPEICQDGLDLRAEEKCFAVPVVVERFDTEAIASHKEAPLSRIPNGKSKHAAQILNTVGAVFLIQVDDGFSVALRTIAVTAIFQINSQLSMVVDLAVEDNPDIRVFIRNRLMPSLEIDDAQPAHGQANIPFHKETIVIRSPMHDLLVHPGQRAALCPLLRIGM